MLRIHLLGALRLDDDERSLPFVALPKVLPLWAYLLLHRDETISRDALAFALWPHTTEVQAKANLRRHLYDLRRVLPEPPGDTPWLLITPQTVQWNPRASYWLDVGAFEQLSRIPDCLPAAIELYAGLLLASLDEEWLWFERERLHALYLNTLRQSMTLHRQKGDLVAAMQDAQRGLADDPLREDFVREQIALQYALGDRAGALQAYRQFAQALKVELDAPPMPETQELARLMLHNAPARKVLGLPDSDLDRSPDSAPAPLPGNVTAPVRLLVGRDELVAEVERMLSAESPARLVTLTGPGGIGKTRLAHEVAFRCSQQRSDHFQHGVVTVALAALQDPEFVLPAMYAALGAKTKADVTCLDGLVDYLRYRRMLLVLDNFEHVLPAALALNALLQAAPGLRLLVTSQVLLNLYGEHEIGVTPLALADPRRLPPLDHLVNVPAVALFCESARAAAGPHFQLDQGNAAAVAELCLRLDGVPLAIELAAARSKLFTPAELLEQLDHALDALRSRAVDVPERHRTLRAAVEWSYRLLDSDEKQLFARLALFPGGFTTESVAALMDITPAAALDALERMLEKNIIRFSQHKTGPQPRFLMLAVLRAYAEEWQRNDEAIEMLCLRRAQYFAVRSSAFSIYFARTRRPDGTDGAV